MLKQLTIVFAMFIAIAMTQTQTPQLSSLVANRVTALVNQTANSKNTTASNSLSTLTACGLDLGCIITNLLTTLLLNPLIYGLRGLLTVVVFLVQFLLMVVQFILNIVLGLIMGLLESVLANPNLKDIDPQLLSTLKGIQPLLNTTFQQVEKALQDLTNLPLVGQH